MSTERRTERRIVIHGCSGSGKSTLARRLGQATDLPVIELDGLFHQPGWVPTPGDEFIAKVAHELDLAEQQRGGWIVDGNYDSTLHGLVRQKQTSLSGSIYPDALSCGALSVARCGEPLPAKCSGMAIANAGRTSFAGIRSDPSFDGLGRATTSTVIASVVKPLAPQSTNVGYA